MPHVELSLIEGSRRLAPPEQIPDQPDHPDEPRLPPASSEPPLATPGPGGSLARWAAAVAGAAEPSLVLDADGVIVAASASCADLIGLGDPAAAHGRRLRDAVIDLVDFTATSDKLDNAEADKIPPLMAISSGGLARSLVRVACPETNAVSTMDAIATPLWDGPVVVGSLTFFARI